MLAYSQNGNIIEWKEIIEKESLSVKNQKLLKYFFNRYDNNAVIEIDTIYSLNSIFVVGLNCNSMDEEEVFLSLIDENYRFIAFKSIKRKYAIFADGGHIYYNAEIQYIENEVHAITSSSSYNLCEMENAPVTETESKSAIVFRIQENEIIKEKKKIIETKTFVKDEALNKLEKLNKSELRLLRNYYFAKYNYKFKSQDLIEYFSNNLNCYHSENNDVTDRLTDMDKFLIQYILDLEKK